MTEEELMFLFESKVRKTDKSQLKGNRAGRVLSLSLFFSFFKVLLKYG